MIDLTTTYLGLNLANPLVPSASPLTEELDNIRRMEDAGAPAVVLHSLFEEQITLESHELDRFLGAGTESFPESLTYLPDLTGYNRGPDGYLEHLLRAKKAVRIPIIASLNGVSPGGWTKYARKIEQAGANALELNIYDVPIDAEVAAAEIENRYCELVREVKATVEIPVAVKLSPYFTSMPHMAQKLDQAGASALVLFNRFYQPDFDLESLDVVPNLVLSNSYELLRTGANRAASPALGGYSLRKHPGGYGGHRGRSYRPGRAEDDDGGRARRHDDVGAAQERHPPLGRSSSATRRVDGRA